MQPCAPFHTCDFLGDCRWQNAQISSPLGIGAAQFAGPFKAFFRCDDSDDLIDHSRRRNGSLYDFGTSGAGAFKTETAMPVNTREPPEWGRRIRPRYFLTVLGDFVMLAPK